MKGSFIPDLRKSSHNEISELLSRAVEQVFSTESTNFLSLNSINGLRVIRGVNNLDTCYQYAVVDEEQEKLLNIKVYDKTLDLIGRDGMQMVGSRLGHILGCKGQYNTFIKRVCQAKNSGLTRLEISICRRALQKFRPWQASIKTLWHKKTQVALDFIVKEVLQSKTVLKHIIRSLSLPHLLGKLGQCSTNLLLIGRENSWLVNARTSHKQHFVGTRKLVGLTRKASRFDTWKALKTFALRYASTGSTIRVFVLHSKDGHPSLASEFEKKTHLPYQPPGCIKRGGNGVKLPPFIQIPIEGTRLDSDGLVGWDEA